MSAPIVVHRDGRSFRVHAEDTIEDRVADPAKYALIVRGMMVGCDYWRHYHYASSAIPGVLKTIVESIKGRGYSVILRD